MESQRSDEDEPLDIVQSGRPSDLSGPEAFAHVLDQSNREAAANRAQARELIKALSGVQRSQEYLGTALREERRRSRWLLALLALAPVAAGAGVWWIADRVDGVKSDIGSRLVRLAADEETARSALATRLEDARLAQLDGDLGALRHDLESTRVALDAERRQVADREKALAAVEGRAESARTEIGAMEWEVKSAKAKAAAQQARADILERRIGDMQAEIDARLKVPAPQPVGGPAASGPSSSAAPDASAKEPKPAEKPTPADAATVEKARTLLNALLQETGEPVRYEFASIGAMGGGSLRDVRVVGSDDQGKVVRTILAARAEVVVERATGTVVLRFYEGRLILGAVEAPFFGGTYGLIVRGDAAKWRGLGLDCVKSN